MRKQFTVISDAQWAGQSGDDDEPDSLVEFVQPETRRSLYKYSF